MLRRIAVIFFAALFLAHPSLTSVFADEALVVPPPSPSLATATPTATVNAATGTPSTDTTHWTATPTSTATTPPTGSSTAVFLPATPTPRATRTARATPTARPTEVIPPENIYWVGTARVTMYTCVELGGCNYTASGLWPYEGIVAVDPRLIPLGATVWLDGLGIFLAADTGALVYGNRVDVYVNDYHRAINWGVQERRAAAYIPP